MRHFPKTFLWASLSSLCLICSISLGETPHVTQTGSTTSPPLEIHVSLLRWENACLLVGLDLTNHSNVPVFLTVMGPYFDVALDVSKDDSSNHDALDWVNVRGVSNVVSWDAEPLAPNSPSHKNYCIGETVWVVNQKKETRREIPIRGKMRISASFFLNEDVWKKNKAWHYDPKLAAVPRNPWNPPEDIAPKWSTVTIDIPCPNATFKQDCARSPLGFHGEGRVVPDVYFIDAEWNRRGETVTNGLNRKYSPCAETR
jgi:hypothetical protein